jgi:hypothetical protein
MYVLLYCGVCTGVKLLPPGENTIAVRNNNNNNNNNNSNNTSGMLDVREVYLVTQQVHGMAAT